MLLEQSAAVEFDSDTARHACGAGIRGEGILHHTFQGFAARHGDPNASACFGNARRFEDAISLRCRGRCADRRLPGRDQIGWQRALHIGSGNLCFIDSSGFAYPRAGRLVGRPAARDAIDGLPGLSGGAKTTA